MRRNVVKRKPSRRFFAKKSSKLWSATIFDGNRSSPDNIGDGIAGSQYDHAQLLLKAHQLSQKPLPTPALPYLEQELNSHALKELHNTVFTCANADQQLSGTIFALPTPQPLQLSIHASDTVVSVAVGERHCAFATLQGKLYVCGSLFTNYPSAAELVEPKLVETGPDVDVIGVAAFGKETVVFIDDAAHCNTDIALLRPDFTLGTISKDDDLTVVDVSERAVVLRKDLRWREAINFVRKLRTQLRTLRTEFPTYEVQDWAPYEDSFKRIAESSTLLMRAMLSLLVYLQTRTLRFPPDNFVESQLVRLIETLVRILDVFLRSVRMFQLLAMKEEEDKRKKKKTNIVTFFEQTAPKYSDLVNLMENLQTLEPDERMRRALSDTKERKKLYLKFYKNVLLSIRKFGELKPEIKAGLLNSVLNDSATKVRILPASDVEVKQISGEGPGFSKGSLILTNSSLVLIDSGQKTIAKYPLQFIWIGNSDTSLVLQFPEMAIEVRCGPETVCFRTKLIKATNRIFKRDRELPRADIGELRSRNLRAWTFISGPDEGATYTGDWRDGKPHGFGVLRNAKRNGSFLDYEGEFCEGQFHGLGSCVKYITEDRMTKEHWRTQWHRGCINGFGMWQAFSRSIDPQGHRKSEPKYPEFMGVFKDGKKDGDFFEQQQMCDCFVHYSNDKKAGKSLTIDHDSAGGAVLIRSYENDECKIAMCQTIGHNYEYFGSIDENRLPNGQGVLRLYIDDEPKIVEMRGIIHLNRASTFPVVLKSSTDEYDASVSVTCRPAATALSHLLRPDCANFSQRCETLFDQCSEALQALTRDNWWGMRNLQRERNAELDIDFCAALADQDSLTFEEWQKMKTTVTAAIQINCFPINVFLALRNRLFRTFTAIALIDWSCITQTVVNNFNDTVDLLYKLLRVLLPKLPENPDVEFTLSGADRSFTGRDLALDILPPEFFVIVSMVLNGAIQTRWKDTKKAPNAVVTEALGRAREYGACRSFFKENLKSNAISTPSEATEFLDVLKTGDALMAEMLQRLEIGGEENRVSALALVIKDAMMLRDRPRDHFAFNLLLTKILTKHRISAEGSQLLERMMQAELFLL